MSSQSSELTTSELAVLETLQGTTEAVSQRELARRTGFSVGLVNAVLKKLVHTGYIKTTHLNRRTVEYLLTPQGFAQAAMRSYRYVIDTVRKYRAIKSKLHEILEGLRAEGFTDFFLHGDGELAEVVGLFFDEEGVGPLHRGMIPRDLIRSPKLVLLNTEPTPLKPNGCRVVDLVYEFANGKNGAKRSTVNKEVKKITKSVKGVDAVREFYTTDRKTGE